jgi:UDP-perosamine 4-acetyltransferase
MSKAEKLIIIGAGGHARSVMDIALENGDYEIAGCIDPTPGEVLGKPVIGNDADLETFFSQGMRYIFVAIGNNALRHRLFEKALSIGFEPVNIISRHTTISRRAHLGKGICIMAGAVINVNTVIGDNCIINTRCSIDHDCQIGKSSHIAPGVTLSGTVKSGEGVHIGTGASVIDGITIGDWSYIGGGAVVVDDIPPEVMAYGVPARVIRQFHPQKEFENHD